MDNLQRPQLWFPSDASAQLFTEYCHDLELHGVTYVWHNLVKDNQSVSYVSDKDWAKRYFEGNCTEFDIVDHYMYDRGLNFFLWRDIAAYGTEKQRELMREREADYKIFNGVTIALENKAMRDGRYVITYRETLSLATNSKTFDLPEFCLGHYPLIKEYLEKMSEVSLSLIKTDA